MGEPGDGSRHPVGPAMDRALKLRGIMWYHVVPRYTTLFYVVTICSVDPVDVVMSMNPW